VVAHRLEQLERAEHVGLHERVGAVDRAVDVGLGREVDDRVRAVAREQVGDERAVADVAAHERVARVAADRREVAEVPRVGELVEVHDRLAGRREPVEREVRADEAGAAGDEDHGSANAGRRRFYHPRGPEAAAGGSGRGVRSRESGVGSR